MKMVSYKKKEVFSMKITKKALGLLMVVGTMGITACSGGGITVNSQGDTSKNDVSQSYGDGDKGKTTSGSGSAVSKISEAALKAFKKVAGLSEFNVNIQNATSLGLSKKKADAKKMRLNLDDEDADGDFETTQTLVKTTSETTANNPSVGEDGALDVSFTKIDTTVTTKTTNGRKTLIAGLKDGDNNEVIVKEYGEDNITFESDEKHEYRVVDGLGNVIQNWTKGNAKQTTTADLPVNHSKGWDEFKLYYRYSHHNVEDVDTSYYIIDYDVNVVNGVSIDAPLVEDDTSEDINYGYTTTWTYTYRLIDGDHDHPVTEWAHFDVTPGHRVAYDLSQYNPAIVNPRIERKCVYRRSAYDWIDTGSTKTTFTPQGKNSISFWASGRYYWDNDEEKNSEVQQFCLKDSEGNIVVDWTTFEENGNQIFENIPYVEPITTRFFAIESRSIDAVVSYPAYNGFKYTLKDTDTDQTVLINEATANDPRNVSNDETLVTFDGLIEGHKYILEYSGVGEEVTVEQTRVGGEIDKMYVYNDRFTFVSFVPYGSSTRPSDDELVYEKDGIANYDKRDYYTGDLRQSFIFDNYSGYIYLIKNFNIKYIHNNLLLSAADNFVYDFRINEDNDLEIYALFTNAQVNYFNFFKDKHGNKVVQNDKLDLYDEDTNTYYFVAQCNSDELTSIMTCGEFSDIDQIYKKANDIYRKYEYQTNVNWDAVERERSKLYELANSINQRNNYTTVNNNDTRVRYYLTDTNETLFIQYYDNEMGAKKAYLIVDDSTHRELTVRDSFMNVTSCSWDNEVIKCSSGYLLTMNMYYDSTYEQDENGYQVRTKALYGRSNYSFFLDLTTGHGWRSYDYDSGNYFDVTYLGNYDTFLIYNKKQKGLFRWAFKDIANSLVNTYYYYDDNDENIWSKYNGEFKFMEGAELVKSNVTINEKMNAFEKQGVNGTTYYDIVVEDVNGELKINTYESGTYEAPEIKVVLQPINR